MPKSRKTFNYENAVSELEQIVSQMEKGELDIDQLAQKISYARTLIDKCKEKLKQTDCEVKQLLEEETER